MRRRRAAAPPVRKDLQNLFTQYLTRSVYQTYLQLSCERHGMLTGAHMTLMKCGRASIHAPDWWKTHVLKSSGDDAVEL